MTNEFDQSYLDYQTRRGMLRGFVRGFYLRRAASEVSGPCIDFGCGAGELLDRLPRGSKGLEYNEAAVRFCCAQGKDVCYYDGFLDGWNLSGLESGAFTDLILSHVLEHFENPGVILQSLLLAATALGIQKVIVIVPGEAGFRMDSTHKTFVEKKYLDAVVTRVSEHWRAVKAAYFPLPLKEAGNYFAHNELHYILERVAK